MKRENSHLFWREGEGLRGEPGLDVEGVQRAFREGWRLVGSSLEKAKSWVGRGCVVRG